MTITSFSWLMAALRKPVWCQFSIWYTVVDRIRSLFTALSIDSIGLVVEAIYTKRRIPQPQPQPQLHEILYDVVTTAKYINDTEMAVYHWWK